MLVGDRIKLIRQKAGISREQIAQCLGVDPGVMAEYESGQRPIPVNHLERFGSLFGLRLADLVLVDDTSEESWDLKPRSRIALPTGIDGGDLSGIADVGRIVLNLDEMATLVQKTPMPEQSN
ncbi:MAG TPA: helix-turn-helix domain-containing protein [Anaerolineaceae bacterium]|nr:helix-turn-helix domain-containing protein [Anaerolineaceae bacterium]HPN50061.1 helix-turn-helix domain-containing protein [Anaerolineaceae bacterium]